MLGREPSLGDAADPSQAPNGAILASFAIVSAGVTTIGRKLSPHIALRLGVGAMTAGVSLLWLAVRYHILALLLGATSVTGAGYALLFLGALTMINVAAPEAGGAA